MNGMKYLLDRWSTIVAGGTVREETDLEGFVNEGMNDESVVYVTFNRRVLAQVVGEMQAARLALSDIQPTPTGTTGEDQVTPTNNEGGK